MGTVLIVVHFLVSKPNKVIFLAISKPCCLAIKVSPEGEARNLDILSESLTTLDPIKEPPRVSWSKPPVLPTPSKVVGIGVWI